MKKNTFTPDQAKEIGEQLGIRWDKFDLKQFRDGLVVELEHGAIKPKTDVTGDDPLLTGKIALAGPLQQRVIERVVLDPSSNDQLRLLRRCG